MQPHKCAKNESEMAKQNDEGKRKWKQNHCRSTITSKKKNKNVNDERCAFFWLFMLFGWFSLPFFFTLCKEFFSSVFCCRWMISKRQVERHSCIFHSLYFNDKRCEFFRRIYSFVCHSNGEFAIRNCVLRDFFFIFG